jgi:hypothetical protein
LVYLNAAKGIGPWMSWIRRGLDLYLASKGPSSATSFFSFGSVHDTNPIMKSLVCYLYAGELGYEVAQSNAAYILRTKIIPAISGSSLSHSASDNSKELFSWEKHTLPMISYGYTEADMEFPETSSSKEIIKINQWYSKNYLMNVLLFHQYLLSGKLHLQMENIFYLGNCYFHKRCGFQFLHSPSSVSSIVVPKEKSLKKKAMYYYQLSSYGRNPVASAYLGMMYHFNLFQDEEDAGRDGQNGQENWVRAARYYEEVLKVENIQNHPQMKQLYYFIKFCHQMLLWKSNIAFYPVHVALESVMKWFWT